MVTCGTGRCSVFIPVTVIKHTNRKQLSAERIYFSWQLQLWLLVSGDQGRNIRGLVITPQLRAEINKLYILNFLLAYPQLDSTTLTQLGNSAQGMVSPTVDWVYPHQLRRSRCKQYLINPFFSSDLGFVKLTLTSHHNHCKVSLQANFP